MNSHPNVHPTASVSPTASIGERTRIWHWTQVGDGARIGDDCIVGSGVYVDRGVVIGNKVKIQTGAQLYRGAVVEDGVFVGPNVCLTNDRYPRAVTPDGQLKTDADWVQGTTRVGYGASLGAGAILLPDVTVGRFAMVGAGALVVTDVPDHALVVGSPARLVGYVCACGQRLLPLDESDPEVWACRGCEATYVRLAARWIASSADRGPWVRRDLPVAVRVP